MIKSSIVPMRSFLSFTTGLPLSSPVRMPSATFTTSTTSTSDRTTCGANPSALQIANAIAKARTLCTPRTALKSAPFRHSNCILLRFTTITSACLDKSVDSYVPASRRGHRGDCDAFQYGRLDPYQFMARPYFACVVDRAAKEDRSNSLAKSLRPERLIDNGGDGRHACRWSSSQGLMEILFSTAVTPGAW